MGTIGIFGLAGITSARKDPREISEGTVIDERGDYVLAGNIVNEDYDPPCIEITADNVTLDGRGYAIRHGSGVKVTGDNVTVENLSVTGYRGIEYTQAKGGTIRNNTTRGEDGIHIESTTRTLIEGNECRDDVSTITLRNADGNIVRKNRIHGEYGPALIDSTRNRVEDNHISGGETGLSVIASKNVVRQNTVASSLTAGLVVRGDQNRIYQNSVTETESESHFGVHIEGASGNRLHQNMVTNNAGGGVTLRAAEDNRLVQNTVCQNDAAQILIDEESTGNRLIKNETNCP